MPRHKQRPISIRGARTHNLKNVDVEIPANRLTVVTGPSGSGKSSLAFDTLFAEGQRRYVESLSTYARQFIQQMPRPDVDAIDNILPAIALEQKNTVKNARSTVGTATEIQDYLALMFGRIGRTFCPDCDCEAIGHDPQSASLRIKALDEGTRLIVVAPMDLPPARTEETTAALRADLMKRGWARLWDDGDVFDVEQLTADRIEHADALRVVTDRIVTKPSATERLTGALEDAFDLAAGRAEVHVVDGDTYRFSSDLVCAECGRRFDTPRPPMFSFYSPVGACPECEGFGRVIGIDMDKVIPDRNLSMSEGLVHPWNTPTNQQMYPWFQEVFEGEDFPWTKPFNKLSAKHKRWIVDGARGFWGVKGFFAYLERKKYKIQSRVMLARYRAYVRCTVCDGARLDEPARNVRVGGHRIADLNRLSIEQLAPVIAGLDLNERERETVDLVLRELTSRVDYLNSVGLGYLTLDRQTRTLSGGETQRINLATALGSSLTHTLYVLDEPTVGLHARDTQRLIDVLKRLRDNDNTVVVVEHDPLVMRASDRMIDLGPAAGERGGEIIYEGTVKGLARRKSSATGRFLSQAATTSDERKDRSPTGWITVRGARANNLKDIDVALPLGTLCCLTGVSGSGKSSLLRDVVFAGSEKRKGKATVDVGEHDDIEGLDQVDDVLLIDQSPLGRSARSNPVTYVKAYDEIRKLFATAAVSRGIDVKPGYFSFNVDGGRCPECQGAGSVTVDMHFLADVETTCETCEGTRFRREALEIDYAGRSIHDVLQMTVNTATEFFADQKKIVRALGPLRDVGLGYLRLGQTTSTLSGGEAQRIKLAGVLAGRSLKKNYLLLFDEPTTGLHPTDIDQLLAVMNRLVEAGSSLIVIEHNLDFIARSDHVIDLGPEGGDKGGEIIYTGPTSEFLECRESETARCLREALTIALEP